jgi:hypothetical protein
VKEEEGRKAVWRAVRGSDSDRSVGSGIEGGHYSVIDSSSGLQIRSNVCKYRLNNRTCNVTDSRTRTLTDTYENICDENFENKNENSPSGERNSFRSNKNKIENENENEKKFEFGEISEIASNSFFTDFKLILNEFITIASEKNVKKVEKNKLEKDGKMLKNEKNFGHSNTVKNVFNLMSKEKFSFLSVNQMTYGECKRNIILNLNMITCGNSRDGDSNDSDHDYDNVNYYDNYNVNNNSDNNNRSINNDDIHHEYCPGRLLDDPQIMTNIGLRHSDFIKNKNTIFIRNSHADAKNILFTDYRFFTDWINKSDFM